MWANHEIVELVEWLKEYNSTVPENKKAGFYGLDVYSLWDSMRAIIDYLRKVDGDLIKTALKAYECFEPYHEDIEEYARATAFVPTSCEHEVVELLSKIQKEQPQYKYDGREAGFNIEQNALVAKNAERYYRTMIYGGPDSWNIRDAHMAETLERLIHFFGPHAKGIVWAHNTHIGDARFTDMADIGEFNIGQLVRERHKAEEVVLVGFGSYKGSVIAARQWGAPMQEMEVPPAQGGSWESLLHYALGKDTLLLLENKEALSKEFFKYRDHRAIGVVYNAAQEFGNYVPTILANRYDAFFFLDTTHALSPLHLKVKKVEEVPETFPAGV